MPVQITGLTLNPEPKPMGHRGGRILAFFDCTIDGIGLFGCAYVQNHNGSFTVFPPKLGTKTDPRRRVAFVDPALRSSIRDAAGEAYRTLA